MRQPQRIRLQPEDSPVVFEGTITQMAPTGDRIEVVFDTPVSGCQVQPAFKFLAVAKLDSTGRDTGEFRLSANGRLWVVR